jgi:hypothetical protein
LRSINFTFINMSALNPSLEACIAQLRCAVNMNCERIKARCLQMWEILFIQVKRREKVTAIFVKKVNELLILIYIIVLNGIKIVYIKCECDRFALCQTSTCNQRFKITMDFYIPINYTQCPIKVRIVTNRGWILLFYICIDTKINPIPNVVDSEGYINQNIVKCISNVYLFHILHW